jgi:hypothetical protein
MYVCIYEWQWHFYSLFMFLSSCFLKYCWPTTLSFSNFLFEPKKKWGESTTTVGQYIEICAFFYRFSWHWIFFLLVLFSRVSMIIQGGTTTPRLCGYYCRPSRTEEKKIGEKESTRELDISYRTYERKKEMNPVTFVIYFGNYHEINAYFQRINLQCAPYEMTSSYIWCKLVTIYACLLILPYNQMS